MISSRLHKISDLSHDAFFFETHYASSDLSIQEIKVDYFDYKEAEWRPIEFKLDEKTVSTRHGKYLFKSPSGARLRVEFDQDYYLEVVSLNNEKSRYAFKLEHALPFRYQDSAKEEYVNEVYRKQFLDVHDKDFTKEKESYFSLFSSRYRSAVKDNWSIADIFSHAAEKDNRSHKICMRFGWMKPDGTLTELGLKLKKICQQQSNQKVLSHT